MEKEKTYIFTFIDIYGDETHEKLYRFPTIKDAREHAKKLIAEAKDNTEHIKVKFSHQ